MTLTSKKLANVMELRGLVSSWHQRHVEASAK
jgi:hypothetical protein